MLPLDLTAPGAADALEAQLKAAAPEVRVLVCAAGFGRMGDARALLDSRRGRAVSTPGAVCTVHRYASKCLSDAALMALWEGLRRL